MTFDLAAERSASRARQWERGIESRARMILAGRWDMTRFEIMQAIAERYPAMPEAGADQLAEAALEIRTNERRRFSAAPSVPQPEETQVPTLAQIAQSEEFKTALREFLRARPNATAPEARKAVEEKLGRAVAESSFYREWRAATADAPKADTPAPAPIPAGTRSIFDDEKRTTPAPNGNGAHAPTNRIAAADEAFSEAVHGGGGTTAVPSTIPPMLAGGNAAEEIRSLRATYEAGQYVRIEEEDGVWCLRVSLEFPTRGEALNAMTGLLGTVE